MLTVGTFQLQAWLDAYFSLPDWKLTFKGPGHLYLIVVIIACSTKCFAELQKFEHPPKGDGSLSFLVIGDWGRKGSENQSEVATQMGKVAKQLDIDFVISTGDNFYDDGLKGVTDPNFEESFSRIYTASSLQKPWYSVLGNHDYRGDGHHGNTQELICHVLPILQANNADFYMNGHDHCLEHLSTQDSSIQFFTSGAGSRAWRGDVKGQAGNGGIEFFYDGQGFMSVQLNQSDAQIVFYDVSGDILHEWKTSKAHLHSAI